MRALTWLARVTRPLFTCYLAVMVTTASIIRYPANPFHLLPRNRVDLDACHSLNSFNFPTKLWTKRFIDELQKETLANGSKICSGFFEFVLKIIKMDKRKWTKNKISFRPLLVFIVLIDDSWLRVYRERNAKSIVMEIIKMDKKKVKFFSIHCFNQWTWFFEIDRLFMNHMRISRH